MTERALFQAKQVCVCCGAETTPRLRNRRPGEPNMIAVSFTVYRRGRGKGQLKAASKVNICENCMAPALQSESWWKRAKEPRALLSAIQARISDCYSAMVREDQKAA